MLHIVEAKKAARQNTAFEHAAEFAFDEFRHVPALFFLPGQKRFEILLEHAVDKRLLGIARAVLSGRIVSPATPGVAQHGVLPRL